MGKRYQKREKANKGKNKSKKVKNEDGAHRIKDHLPDNTLHDLRQQSTIPPMLVRRLDSMVDQRFERLVLDDAVVRELVDDVWGFDRVGHSSHSVLLFR